MTHYLNTRAGPWGAVCSPFVLVGDALRSPPAITSLQREAVPFLVRGKDVLLATHGFNVSYESGLRSLQRLESALAIDPLAEMFFGVLWPGDWVIPAINYPAEDGIASHAGAALAGFCNQWLGSARSISMLSHSLGARVILEAIKGSSRRIRRACITAGAVNSAALREEYAAAAAKCDEIRTLSSRKDLVLEFAYPPGDLLADLLDPDHPPCEPALGRGGPAPPFGAGVRSYEIADAPAYDHGNYFPPGDLVAPPPPNQGSANWMDPVNFMASAFRGRAPAWP